MNDNKKDYWNKRWQHHETGWDIGYASNPIAKYLDELPDRSIRILIPGCGNAYEGWHAWNLGFKNIILIDFAELPLKHFQQEHPDFPAHNLLCEDFFEHQGKYDLILEQTFFCAIPIDMREHYVLKMHDLLMDGGRLSGVFFDCTFDKEGPPFGGSREEYEARFSKHFHILKMEKCKNSITPRLGRELFVELQKK